VVESKTLVGHEAVLQFFANSLELDRLCSTYLFSGRAGIGKRLLCKTLAQLILCKQRDGRSACGSCSSCLAFEDAANPYFQERHFFLERSSNESAVDVVRGFIRDVDKVSSSKHKSVYLLPNFESYSNEVQNALLKTLEEPPVGIVIFLTTDNEKGILETIHSRSQVMHLSPLTPQQMKQSLTQQGIGSDDLDHLIRLSEGSMEMAMNYSHEAYRAILVWIETVLRQPQPDFLSLAEEAKVLGNGIAKIGDVELSERQQLEEWVKIFEKFYFEKALSKVRHHFVAMQILNTTLDDLLSAKRSIVSHGLLSLSLENYLQIAISRWMQMMRFVRIPEETYHYE